MSKKQPDRGRGTKNVYDIEAQQKHLRRHLESLERDNHQPLDDVEGLVTVALAHIEDDNSGLKLKSMYAYAHGGLLMVMDTLILGRKRQKVSRANPFSTRQNLSALILEAVRTIFHLNRYSHAQFTNSISYFQRLDLLPPDIPTYLTCNAAPSQYPSRQFCSVCSFQSSYKCSKCGMKYCSVKCLRTHEETRFALTIQVYTISACDTYDTPNRCMKWTI